MEDCAQEEGTLDVDIVSILVPLRLMVKREVKGHGQLNTPVIPYFTTVRLRRSGGRIPPPFAENEERHIGFLLRVRQPNPCRCNPELCVVHRSRYRHRLRREMIVDRK
jgi:hypothetical protein